MTTATPDKKTVIRDLTEQAKAKGQLSNKEILDAIGELDFEPEQLEKFYDTLEEVGKEFNVTRERIRQIEAKALRKLRHPSRSKKLKDFLD